MAYAAWVKSDASSLLPISLRLIDLEIQVRTFVYKMTFLHHCRSLLMKVVRVKDGLGRTRTADVQANLKVTRDLSHDPLTVSNHMGNLSRHDLEDFPKFLSKSKISNKIFNSEHSCNATKEFSETGTSDSQKEMANFKLAI